MKISVVIPTYNRVESLSRALNSILTQIEKPDEIIVVDDGSTDNTAELIKNHFPDVRYIFQKNNGVSAARNVGIEASNYDWIAFLDSDDEWMPHKLIEQKKHILESPNYQFCHTEEIWMRNGKFVNQMKKHKKSGGHIFDKCLPLCVISPSSVLMKKSLFEEVGLFREDLPACEDYDLWLKICAKQAVGFVEKPSIIKHGGHEDQLSKKHWGMDRFRIKSLVKILEDDLLKEEYKLSAIQMLQKKLGIFLNGAKKRNNMTDVTYFESILKNTNYD